MGQRILVVDDEEGIVLLLKDYFELQGYEVVTAGGGVEALEKICCNPDMILLDINMPDLDGLSVCREIREKVDCPRGGTGPDHRAYDGRRRLYHEAFQHRRTGGEGDGAPAAGRARQAFRGGPERGRSHNLLSGEKRDLRFPFR